MNPRSELFETFAIQGMSMRDYFAAKAMQALVDSITDGSRFMSSETIERCAGAAYTVADAMMKAREE